MGLRHWLCCAIAACAVTASASQRAPAKTDQQVLIELEQDWNEAFYRHDVALSGVSPGKGRIVAPSVRWEHDLGAPRAADPGRSVEGRQGIGYRC